MAQETSPRHRVVIVGGGFGGLYAARKLGNAPVVVTLIDRRNFHLFQPLLYQVATGGLSPGDIASPLRAVLNKYRNIRVIMGEVTRIDPRSKTVFTGDEAFDYDTLIVATGSTHHYFGNAEWETHAPGLKTVEDALDIRAKILAAFEIAERKLISGQAAPWGAELNFAIVGAGPTGVEMAGAMAELAYATLKKDFRQLNTREAKIILIEAGPRILPGYPQRLSHKAQKSLTRLGVRVKTHTRVKRIAENELYLEAGDAVFRLPAAVVIWAAGVTSSPLSGQLAQTTGAATGRSGRIRVEPDLSLREFPEIFVVGDLALVEQDGAPLPGVAPVAMQQGKYVARLIRQRLRGKTVKPFRYFDKGNLAVIGRNAAIADFGFLRLSGWFAWIIWVFIHIAYLIEFDNRMLVLFQWGWNYLTRNRGARLITRLGRKCRPAAQSDPQTR